MLFTLPLCRYWMPILSNIRGSPVDESMGALRYYSAYVKLPAYERLVNWRKGSEDHKACEHPKSSARSLDSKCSAIWVASQLSLELYENLCLIWNFLQMILDVTYCHLPHTLASISHALVLFNPLRNLKRQSVSS